MSSPPSKRTWLDWLVWLATEDHCTWVNRYVYWVKTPLGILVCCAVFSLLCGVLVAPQAFMLLAVIAAVVLIGMAWPSFAVRGLECQLVYTASRGREGKPTQAKLVVANRWPWPVWGLAVDDPAFARASGAVEQGSETTVALARINGWSRSTYDWTFVPPLRGVYPSQEVRIVTGFPFGLRRASRPVNVQRSLIVWPETFWLPPLEEVHSRKSWGGELSETLVGADGTRIGVRDFRQGDSLRDVNWSKSARHERLIVSEREASVVEECTIVVDVDPARHTGSGRDSTLEWSLRIAASICESVVGKRGRVELWLGANRIQAANGEDALGYLLDSIARLNPDELTPNETSLPQKRLDSADVIGIGTDASPALPGRAIVLNRAAFTEFGETWDRSPPPWISVEASNDVPGQILAGWRCTRRRPQRAR